ncbi:MAG TPA: cupin domain-containing protein [Chloroflexota bacterium]|nr:cupin domain-containing protein [Chloroflexota bacterium]
MALAACSSGSAGQPGAPQFLLDRTLSGYEITVDQESYPAHYAGLLHTHPGPGSFCVLQGQLRIEVVGQAAVALGPGQCWAEPPGVAHRPVNDTDQPAVAVFYLLAASGQSRIAAASSSP